MWQVGAARQTLEGDFRGLELLGWGQPEGRIDRVASPLQVRAVALQWGEARLVYVCAELCFITQSVRDGVLAELATQGLTLGEHELTIAATHTHSGPAGYSHDVFYNLSNPGYCAEVFDSIVRAVSDAVLAAWTHRTDGTVSVRRGTIPLDEPVAFNRAIPAYCSNEDAPECDPSRPETATNRDLTVLRVDDAHGPLAAICWFGVHNTNVHFDNRALHGDNKGVAAALLEADHPRTDRPFVGIFAQGAPGDVTPNFRPSPRGFTVGMHDDDFDSATANGEIQYRYAAELLAQPGTSLEGLATAVTWIDFDGQAADADLCDGTAGQTGRARYGLGVIEGTEEGPGPLLRAQFLRRLLVWGMGATRSLRAALPVVGAASAARSAVYGPMFPFLDAGEGVTGRAFGLMPMAARGVPGWIDPVVAEVQRLTREGVDLQSPWTPSVMPLHLARIGSFGLVSLPCEPTTMAGRRLQQTAVESLGVSLAQAAGYSNAYHGYATTREEYQLQGYEAAHTVYGQHTLAVYQTVIRRLAAHLGGEPVDTPQPQPQRTDADELQRRRYQGPPPTRAWG